MNINTITANVRLSKKADEGTFVTIELGGEATLTPQEAQEWKQAQATLYHELTEQMRMLWPRKTNGGNGQGANGTSARPSNTEHYCHEHQTTFKRYEKGESVWHAHKAGQKWCREASK